MSNKFKISFEELQEPIDTRAVEQIDEENNLLASDIDKDSSEITRQSDVLEALECLKLIAERIGTPSPTETALFRTAANLAVIGTEQRAQDLLPAMESNQPIALEDFGTKIKEVVNSIIAKLKEFWKKIVAFFKSTDSKLNNIKKDSEDLKQKVNDVEKDINKTQSTFKEVKPEAPIDLKDLKKEREDRINEKVNSLLDRTNHDNEFLIPKSINIYSEHSVLFPKYNSQLKSDAEKGNYLESLIKRLEEVENTMKFVRDAAVKAIVVFDTQLDSYSFTYKKYLEKDQESRKEYEDELEANKNYLKNCYESTIEAILEKLEISKMLTTSENPSSDITGGFSFQVSNSEDKAPAIYFRKGEGDKSSRINSCEISINIDKVKSQVLNVSDLLRNHQSSHFSNYVDKRMTSNDKLITILETINKFPESYNLKLTEPVKEYLLKLNKLIVAISSYNSYFLDIIKEFNNISISILADYYAKVLTKATLNK